MDELLSMPMLWSSLNGIGEVVTPIVTLNFRSNMSEKLWTTINGCCPAEGIDRGLHEIRRQGSSYPEHGAYGLRFPYRSPVQRPDEHLWTDNGFTSRGAMEAGHEMILSVLGEHMGWKTASGNGGDIIDLGAGNGELLRKLGRGVGIESNTARFGRRVWSGVNLGTIEHTGELFPGQRFAVDIISVRRFEELSEEDARWLRTWLGLCDDHVLIYQYEHPQFARVVAPRDVPVPEVVR